jgi:hypothetical protein
MSSFSTCFGKIKFCTCSVKSRFPAHCRNTNFGQYWLSTVYFKGDFNETFRLLFFHAMIQKQKNRLDKVSLISKKILNEYLPNLDVEAPV